MILIQLFQGHFHHAHGAVHDHFPGVDDGGSLLPLEHRRGDLRRVGQMGDAGFENFQPRYFYFVLDLRFQFSGDFLAAAPKGTFVLLRVRDVVGVQPHDIPQGGIRLNGQKFHVIVHIKYSFRGILHPPDDHNADLDGIAQLVVDFLFAVVQGERLEGYFFAAGGILFLRAAETEFHAGQVSGDAGFRFAALDGGVYGGDEGVDEKDAGFPQCTVVFAEQREDQRFIGPDDFQTRERYPAQAQIDPADDREDYAEYRLEPARAPCGHLDAEDQPEQRGGQQDDSQNQHRDAGFSPDDFLFIDLLAFFHRKRPLFRMISK